MGEAPYTVVHIDEIPEPAHDKEPGEADWKPVRIHLGIKAFGTNAYVAMRADDQVVGEHTEVEDSEEELGAKGRFFEVYVPIRGGVFESYMSYEPTAKAIASDTRTLFLALGAGLLLLWLVLFRVVARASRRLRHQATHDRLTDLPNRAALHREGERTLAGALPVVFRTQNDVLAFASSGSASRSATHMSACTTTGSTSACPTSACCAIRARAAWTAACPSATRAARSAT